MLIFIVATAIIAYRILPSKLRNTQSNSRIFIRCLKFYFQNEVQAYDKQAAFSPLKLRVAFCSLKVIN